MSEAFDLRQTYLHVTDGATVNTMGGGPAFWETIAERTELADGRLVCVMPVAADWPHWEMHPQGDEVLIMLSGACELVLDDGTSERRVPLDAQRCFVVPAGVWHRAIVKQPGEMLALTRGAGTQHRLLDG